MTAGAKILAPGATGVRPTARLEPLAGSHGRGRVLPLHPGWAVTLSPHSAGSLVPIDGPGAALGVAPPGKPPEGTSGTGEGNKGLQA